MRMSTRFRIVLLLLVSGCASHDAASSDATQLPAARATEEDGSCAPKILLTPVNAADIPDFAQKLADAYCHPRLEACQRLPESEPYTFDFGDHSVNAPSRTQWLRYCQALVAADPTQCEGIDRFSEPNLQQSCEYFFQQLAEKNNDSPAFCLEQIDIVYHSADEVGNCLLGWMGPLYGHLTVQQCMAASPMGQLTQFDLDLSCCLRLPRPSTLTAGQPDQQECLYQLAQTSRNDKVCRLIADPYPSNPKSEPSCLAALAQ